jgi:hypothetical protein
MVKPEEFYKSMVVEFNRMRKEGQLIDVTLVFEGKKIPCHRMVLASKCDYFKAMFLSGLKENSAKEIEILGIDGEIGAEIVEYCYTGDLKITEDNAPHLLAATGMLLLEELQSKVDEFLGDSVNKDNCIEFMRLASLHRPFRYTHTVVHL